MQRNRQACSLRFVRPVAGNGLARSTLPDNQYDIVPAITHHTFVGARHASPSCSSPRTPRATQGQGMLCPYNAPANGIYIPAIHHHALRNRQACSLRFVRLVAGNGLARSVSFGNMRICRGEACLALVFLAAYATRYTRARHVLPLQVENTCRIADMILRYLFVYIHTSVGAGPCRSLIDETRISAAASTPAPGINLLFRSPNKKPAIII